MNEADYNLRDKYNNMSIKEMEDWIHELLAENSAIKQENLELKAKVLLGEYRL